MKLFPKMELAVKAMALCCENEDDDKTRCEDAEKSPIARSEVFNETWMLRLALAAIHDYSEGFCHLDGKKNDALKRIQEAVQKRWISEGGLEPAFEKEGTTWTDAILGSVELEGDSDSDKESKSKRKVKVTKHENVTGIVVIEAKMASDLDKGVTHSSDYNQVARSIACLAKLIKSNLTIAKECSFVVLAPKNRLSNWKEDWAKNPVKGVPNIIRNQNERKTHEKDHKMDPKREFKGINNTCSFYNTVDEIQKHTIIMSWEEVIESMKAAPTGAYETLKWFYVQTCKEYNIAIGELK